VAQVLLLVLVLLLAQDLAILLPSALITLVQEGLSELPMKTEEEEPLSCSLLFSFPRDPR
jgi:hypothetical protein